MNFTTRKERQFELRMEGAEASNGGLKGMALKYGEMDSYYSVFAPGSATAALPDFVANGSFLESHDFDDLAIGYIKSAIDNGMGVEVEVEYHSTADAKDARTVALERLAAGKKVGLSIGFTIGDYLEFENGEEMLRMIDTLGMDKNLFHEAGENLRGLTSQLPSGSRIGSIGSPKQFEGCSCWLLLRRPTLYGS